MAITLDGIRFSGDMAGQKALAEHRKKYYTRVVTGYKDKRTQKYGGPPKAGGRGWYTETTQVPEYGYIRKTPYVPPKPAAAAPKAAAAAKPAAAPKPSYTAPKVDYSKQFKAYEDRIAKLQSGFRQTLSDLQSSMAQERKQFGTQLETLQSGFQTRFDEQTAGFQNRFDEQAAVNRQAQEEMAMGYQRALAQQDRPGVEGIRFADRGTGGARQKDLRMQGIRGAFGRKGDRLLKISSLNV